MRQSGLRKLQALHRCVRTLRDLLAWAGSSGASRNYGRARNSGTARSSELARNSETTANSETPRSSQPGRSSAAVAAAIDCECTAQQSLRCVVRPLGPEFFSIELKIDRLAMHIQHLRNHLGYFQQRSRLRSYHLYQLEGSWQQHSVEGLKLRTAGARSAAAEFACAACAGSTSRATVEAREARLPGTACAVDYLPSWDFATVEDGVLWSWVARKRGVVVC
jgi:hypothetical protein